MAGPTVDDGLPGPPIAPPRAGGHCSVRPPSDSPGVGAPGPVTAAPDPRHHPPRSSRWVHVAIGVVLGLVVVGPGLASGPLLNLDLLVTPHVPVPNGIYGLGPALTQRVPFFALLAVGSAVVGGPAATKAAVVLLIALGFVGAARLVDPSRRARPDDPPAPAHPAERTAPDPAGPTAGGAPDGVVGAVRAPGADSLERSAPAAVPPALAAALPVAAGVLWAAGPFALTRLGAGHLNLIWAVGVLPWALPHLWRPAADLRRTFLAALVVAVGGPAAGTLGLAAVVVSLVATRPRPARALRALGASLVANLLWVAPTIVVLWAGAEVSRAGDFATHAGDPGGALAILAGAGFWRPDQQVGAAGPIAGLVAVLLVGLAVAGRAEVRRRWGAGAEATALVGLALAVASAVPGVRSAYRDLSLLPFGAPLRESHRFLALWLAVLAPAAAFGAARVAAWLVAPRRLAEAGGPAIAASSSRTEGAAALRRRQGPGLAAVAVLVPLVAVIGIAAPGWWGLDGRLEPVTFPAGWARARALVRADPGTVVALPWNEYPALSFAGGRTVFNPIPDYLGGDVISSYDPLFDPARPAQEQVDRRAVTVDRIVRRLEGGAPASADLAELGVRWVFLAKEDAWRGVARLVDDPGLRLALDDPAVTLYEVRAWPGPATTPSGAAANVSRPIPPLVRTAAPAGTTLSMAGAPGWVRGWFHPTAVTPDGRLRLGEGRGPVWFWPATVLVAVDLALLAAALVGVARARRAVAGPPSATESTSPTPQRRGPPADHLSG